MAMRALSSAIKAWVYSRGRLRFHQIQLSFYAEMPFAIPRASRLEAPRNRLFANDERIGGRFVRFAMNIAIYHRDLREMWSIRLVYAERRLPSSFVIAERSTFRD